MTWSVEQADCIDFLRAQPEGSVDLVFGSPPYTDARTYDDGTLPEGAVVVRDPVEWVAWMLEVSEAAIHASKGLVAWVVAGVQREHHYWPACEGLMWEWWKRGHYQWCPCVWWKVDADEGGTGIPGSGGKQALRKDWEYVLMFRRTSTLPWADPLVMGHEPIIAHLGGEMSNRTADGRRINEAVGGIETRQEKWSGRGSADDPWGTDGKNGLGGRKKDGTKNSRKAAKERTMDVTAGHDADGNTGRADGRPMPKIANPGNVLPLIVKARVGGGHMGNPMCSLNEAPFPEDLPDFFVQAYSPPGGLVVDPFAGSGTTLAVAVRHGRNAIGCDLRPSQVELARKRIACETPTLFSGEDQ